MSKFKELREKMIKSILDQGFRPVSADKCIFKGYIKYCGVFYTK